MNITVICNNNYQTILIIQVSFYDKASLGTITKCVDYTGVLIFKCPDQQTSLYVFHRPTNTNANYV